MSALERDLYSQDFGISPNNPKRILPETLPHNSNLFFTGSDKFLSYVINHPNWPQNFEDIEIMSNLFSQIKDGRSFNDIFSIVQGMVFQMYALDVVKKTNSDGVLLDQHETQKLIHSVQINPQPTSMHVRIGDEFRKKTEQTKQNKQLHFAEEDDKDELALPSNVLNRIMRSPKQKTPKLSAENEAQLERNQKSYRRKSAKVHLYLPGPLKTIKNAWNPDGFIQKPDGSYTILECVCYNPEAMQNRFNDYCKNKINSFYNSQVRNTEFIDSRLRFIVPRDRSLPDWLEDAVDNPHAPIEKQEVPSPFWHIREATKQLVFDYRKHGDPRNSTLQELWESYK